LITLKAWENLSLLFTFVVLNEIMQFLLFLVLVWNLLINKTDTWFIVILTILFQRLLFIAFTLKILTLIDKFNLKFETIIILKINNFEICVLLTLEISLSDSLNWIVVEWRSVLLIKLILFLLGIWKKAHMWKCIIQDHVESVYVDFVWRWLFNFIRL